MPLNSIGARVVNLRAAQISRVTYPEDADEENRLVVAIGKPSAQGAFAGIRNVATHVEAEWTEQQALEHLAALSVITRRTDEAGVVDGG